MSDNVRGTKSDEVDGLTPQQLSDLTDMFSQRLVNAQNQQWRGASSDGGADGGGGDSTTIAREDAEGENEQIPMKLATDHTGGSE